ncbi:MAG: hypothetical protein PHR02_08435, partial [Sulfuricurvum sp.]|nr:hypothetical protein [Sulfuricurvum sp.]
GKDGDDILIGNDNDNWIAGGSGNDTISGGNGNDELVGDDALIGGNDVIYGGSGDDFIYGGDGNDTLYGGTGNDWIDGDYGNDTISFADASSSVTINLNYGAAAIGAETDYFSNIENVIASEYNDVIAGDSGNNTIDGAGGYDTVVFSNAASYYTVSENIDGSITVTGDGTDTLVGIELLQFSDSTMNFGNESTSPEIISAVVSGNQVILTFSEAMTLQNPYGAHVFSSAGVEIALLNAVGDGTTQWTLTINATIATTDFITLTSDGSIGYGVSGYLSYGTAFIGGTGSNTINLTGVWNYPQPYSVFANNGADTITLDGGDNGSYVNIIESIAAIDVIKFGDQFVDEDFSLINDGPVSIDGFDVSGTTTNDKLSLIANTIKSDTIGYVDGAQTPVALVASHSITSGIVTFKDASGNIININTVAKAQEVYDYLHLNIAEAGMTVAAEINIYGQALVVFQKGAEGTNSFVTALYGVSGVTLSTTTYGLNKVQIIDQTGPEVMNVMTTTEGIRLEFGENVQTANFTGAQLYKNGTLDMGTFTQNITGSSVILSSSTTTLSDTDFVVLDASAVHTFTVTDGASNAWTDTEAFKFAIGGAGNTIIDLGTLTGVMEADGGAGNDTLTGTASNEYLYGGEGDDTLNGLAGDDDLEGGAGDDTIYGGDGDDWMSGGSGNDTLDGGNSVLGNDMDGGSGDDTYVVRTVDDNYWEKDNNGTDKVISYKQSTYLNYNVENLDIMYTLGSTAWGNNLNNTITGSTGADIIDGGEGNDFILGGNGNDTIYGGNGDDNLGGGAGDDTIDGGNGADTVKYLLAGSGVTVDLRITTAQNTVNSGYDTITGIENLTGSLYDDTLNGDDNANIINGSDGNDFIGAQGGNDIIFGGNGDDNIGGGAGDDTIDGGAGNDTLRYTNVSANGLIVDLRITTAQNTGPSGYDTISGIENLSGSSFNDTFTGDDNANIINGLAGDDTISAGGGNDTVYGGDGNDSIGGGAGDDTIDGGVGNDTLRYTNVSANGLVVDLRITTAQNTGPSGYDTITGIENLSGSSFNDTFTGDDNANVLTGGNGNDLLDGQGGDDTAVFTYASSQYTIVLNDGGTITVTDQTTSREGSDTLSNIEYLKFSDTIIAASSLITPNTPPTSTNASVTTNEDTATVFALSHFSFSDTDVGDALTKVQITTLPTVGTLALNSVAVTLNQEILASAINAGQFTFTPAANANGTAYASFGFKVSDGTDYSTTANTVTINVTAVRDDLVLTGTSGNDTLNGDQIDVGSYDTIYGLGGDDIINGGAGNDTVDGGDGNDVLNGGDDIDTVSYESATSGVNVKLWSTAAQATGGSGTDTIVNFENLTGSSYDDILSGDGIANILNGGAGNDTLNGNAGADTMIGSWGNDTYYVDNTGDIVSETTVVGGAVDTGGNDLVISTVSYTLSNYVEALRLNSSSAINGTGSSQNNVIYAGSGDNVMDGQGGYDTVSYESATSGVNVKLWSTAAQATGGSGTDTIVNFENLTGSSYDDILSGDGKANILNGGVGNDNLIGNDGWDTLNGSSGNDILYGGNGNDTLTGGTGIDSFVFNNALNTLSNKDTITDFSISEDIIKLENSIFMSLSAVGTLNASNFVANGSGIAMDVIDYIVYNTSTGALSYDADGSGAGAAIQFATLTGIPNITNVDFIVI